MAICKNVTKGHWSAMVLYSVLDPKLKHCWLTTGTEVTFIRKHCYEYAFDSCKAFLLLHEMLWLSKNA